MWVCWNYKENFRQTESVDSSTLKPSTYEAKQRSVPCDRCIHVCVYPQVTVKLTLSLQNRIQRSVRSRAVCDGISVVVLFLTPRHAMHTQCGARKSTQYHSLVGDVWSGSRGYDNGVRTRNCVVRPPGIGRFCFIQLYKYAHSTFYT
jgi:hypothetical protein